MWLTMHHPVASFLESVCAKNYGNLLTEDKVIAMKAVCIAHSLNVNIYEASIMVGARTVSKR